MWTATGVFLRIAEQIFREYDIRGIVGTELNDDTMAAIAKAYAVFLRERGVSRAVLGFDNRESSPAFAGRVSEVLLASGIDVVNIGLCTSPMMYFARKTLGIDGGVMITASHNAKEFNGIKLAHGLGCIYGDDIQEILRIAKSGKAVEGHGKEEKREILDDYVKYISERVKPERPLNVVLDCGNGTASIVAPALLKALGCRVTELYCESDGTFPNHHPDPTQPDALKDLIALVKKQKADVGISIDGDGDRIGVIDGKGEIIWGDRIMILFAREILAKDRGAKILMEVKCSQALWEEIEKHGGKPVMSRTGHSIIEAKMHADNALLAGEMSGHIYFRDAYFGFDDALYAAARLLRILSRSEESISDMLSEAPQYFTTPEIRLDCPDNKKFEVVEGLKRIFRKGYKTIEIDGTRVLFPDGWALMRASNTQPKLIVRMEAKTEKGLAEIKDKVISVLRTFPEVSLPDSMIKEM
jgi:phosphomannomutase/phosphoglucomutase